MTPEAWLLLTCQKGRAKDVGFPRRVEWGVGRGRWDSQ